MSYISARDAVKNFFDGHYDTRNSLENVKGEDDTRKDYDDKCKRIKPVATLYSYGHHYVMAQIIRIGDRELKLLNADSSSVTTNKHRSFCRSYIDYELPELTSGFIKAIEALKEEVSDMVNNPPKFRASWKKLQFEDDKYKKIKLVDELENLLCSNCDDKIKCELKGRSVS